MQEFIVGQRWSSSGERQLGLGVVASVQGRTVEIQFPATGETRLYSRQDAPLSRVVFAVGDRIRDVDDEALEVVSLSQQSGLITYVCCNGEGKQISLHEDSLNHNLVLNQPLQRLLNQQIDRNDWFELRVRTRAAAAQVRQASLQGLLGARTSLLEHQLYIAHEVGQRFAPRVLLADEVGLGKTIEAGLIMHQQLLNERIQRILIVVPESLQHQWLVEMLRRFNLVFSLFDASRWQAIIEADEDPDQEPANPFHSEQLVLCSMEFLFSDERVYEQSLGGDWDMLVVDEAHHLTWNPGAQGDDYRRVAQLAAVIPAVLLLTATPEQMGKESHFARLQLLDPDRFSDLSRFIAEESEYGPWADLVEALLGQHSLSSEHKVELEKTIQEGDNQQLIAQLECGDPELQHQARERLVDHLLDRHGTGRLLFRNTRQAVAGFPQRQLFPYPLPAPPDYGGVNERQEADEAEPQWLLSPELAAVRANNLPCHWTELDPRVTWLADFLGNQRSEKILVICASAVTALDLVNYLRQRFAITVGAFHEGMSLVERDRTAAWFADPDGGAQALVCSEIGSEGRNFQFASQLVLFDLPFNPDLLEQRIGRLDRIGQSRSVQIHVPYLAATAQQVMFDWLHQALNAFVATSHVAHQVFSRQRSELLRCLQLVPNDYQDLIATGARLRTQLEAEMHQGRDRLLEYNSCRPHKARQLVHRIQELYFDLHLPELMEALCDFSGIHMDIHSPGCWVIKPTDTMVYPVPGLPQDGLTFTYERDIALAREEVAFLTWEHPLLRTLLDLVLSSELGNTSLLAIKYPQVKPGSLLLDAYFRLEISVPTGVPTRNYLPRDLIRVCIDTDGTNHAATLNSGYIERQAQPVDKATAVKIVKAREEMIRDLLRLGEQAANQEYPTIVQLTSERARAALYGEVERLLALRAINPHVREEEINAYRDLYEQVLRGIDTASLRVDALRVLVAI